MTNLPAKLSDEDLKNRLATSGYFTAASGGSTFNRIKVVGTTLVFEDNIIASYDPKTKEPALIVQLLDKPSEYQSMWFDKDGALAHAVGRPDIAGRMCRSHFDVVGEEGKRAEDGTSCGSCPVSPYVPPANLPQEAKNQQGASKCSWRGDIDFRILDKAEDGTLKAEDETVYTISLPTTGMIEFQGSNSRRANQLAGSVSEYNTMVRLAQLGLQKWGDEGIAKAHTMLRLGGVIAEVRIVPTQNKEKNINYNVLSFNPIEILEVTEPTALPDSTGTDENGEALPF